MEPHRGPLGYSPLAAFYSDTRIGSYLAHEAAKLETPYAFSSSSVYSRSSISRSSSLSLSRSASRSASRTRPGLHVSLPGSQNNTNHRPTNSITSTISALSSASTASGYWPGSELLHMLRAAEERADMEVYAAYRPEPQVWSGVRCASPSSTARAFTPASYSHSASSHTAVASHASHATLHADYPRGHYDPYTRTFRVPYFDPAAYYGLEDENY